MTRAARTIAPPVPEALELALHNSVRLLHLATACLERSGVEAQRALARYEPVNLAAFTGELAAGFRQTIERAGLRLRIDCPPLPELVWLDREHWAIVITAVMREAVKFTFRGGITVRLRWAGRSARLSIIDSGGRRPARSLEVDGVRTAADMVKLHGGSMVMQNHEPEGTAVTIWIPAGSALLADEQAQRARTLGAMTLDVSRFVQQALQAVTTAQQAASHAIRGLEKKLGDRPLGEQRGSALSRHWVRQVVLAQEAERRRISRELHDKVGQELAALILGLKAMRKSAKRRTANVALTRLERIAEVVGQDVHDLAADLRPSALDDFGVVRALGNYAEDWACRAGVSVDFHASGLDGVRFPTEVETTTYRVVQEALANVAKHARARNVSVVLERQAGDLIAIVEDDGAGFEPEWHVNGNNKGLGLGVMKERAGLVDGTVEIETAAGQGTTVFLRIPLPLPENVNA